jgi:hypothetical protein
MNNVIILNQNELTSHKKVSNKLKIKDLEVISGKA